MFRTSLNDFDMPTFVKIKIFHCNYMTIRHKLDLMWKGFKQSVMTEWLLVLLLGIQGLIAQ